MSKAGFVYLAQDPHRRDLYRLAHTATAHAGTDELGNTVVGQLEVKDRQGVTAFLIGYFYQNFVELNRGVWLRLTPAEVATFCALRGATINEIARQLVLPELTEEDVCPF